MNDKDKSYFIKLFLAVIAFIVFMTVFGLTVELVKNRKVVNSQPQISSMPVVRENVSAATDKLEYKQGDTIKITIQNNLSQSIGYWNYQGQITPFINIQKFQDGKWEKIEGQNICVCKLNCTTYANGLVELKSNETVNDSWDTKTDCTGKTVSGGKYRVWFSYNLDLTGQGGKFTDIYSKEFNIAKSTENGTADRQTYKNDKYGFEAIYPSDWKVNGTNTDSIVDIMFYDLLDPKFEQGNVNGVKMQIHAESFDQITSLDKFVPSINDLTGKALKTEKITLNGYEARKADMGAAVYFLVSSDGKRGFTIFVWKGNNENLNKIADQILSTFKFTEKDETANWKTYRNEEYGFELKYPTEGDYGFTELSKNEITSSCLSNDSCISCEGLSLTFNKETDPSCETSNMLIPTNNNDVKKEFSNKLNQEGWPDKKEINNLTFYRDYSDDHAMGGQEQREYTYKTLHNNECYKITLSLSLRFAYGFTDDCMNVPQSDFDTSFISKDLFFPILSTFNFTN